MHELNRRMDRFLTRWAWVRAANMQSFAGKAAAAFDLDPIPRLARDAFPYLGIAVAREALPSGVMAVWCVEEGRYVVRLSPFLTGARANFTLWHEFFEIMAARPRFPSPPRGRDLERLADRFAACLTMPPDAVRKAALALGGRGDKAAVLAARFGVSPSAMRCRLRELRLPPFDTPGGRVTLTI